MRPWEVIWSGRWSPEEWDLCFIKEHPRKLSHPFLCTRTQQEDGPLRIRALALRRHILIMYFSEKKPSPLRSETLYLFWSL